MDPTENDPEADTLTEHKKRRPISLKNSPDGASASYHFSDDERPKTRRVNPQRLALRLGPDLVAEMEALIVPGAKMPTFAVRKDFQERYCVDRRHIYDYFHSRGLRVAKEDKHTNLKRVKAIKAAKASQLAPLVAASLLTETPQDFTEHLPPKTPLSYQEARAPRRAATYPNTGPPKRKKRVVPKRRTFMDEDMHLPVPGSPYIHTTPSPTRTPPMESTSNASNEISNTYWLSDGSEALSGDRLGQLLDSGSLSTIEDSQDNDLMTPLGSSWALDQYNNLYDFPNEYYSAMHDTLLIAPYHAQDTFIHFSDSDVQTNRISGEKVEASLHRKLEK